MKKYIVLSVNHNVDYMYFMPLTIWTWRKIGWEPLCIYVGQENEIADMVFDSVDDVTLFKSIEGIRDATISQVSRLFITARPSLNPDDLVMLGDVDMLAMSDHWHPEPNGVTVYNHDLTGFTEIPMCYVAAPVDRWREIMKIDYTSGDWNNHLKRDLQSYANAKSDDFYQWWGCDQQILTERLKQYGTGKIDFINRGQGTHGYARGRVDRGNGGWVLNQPELIDAHLEQQTWQNPAKVQRLYELLAKVWPGEDFTWFKNYTEEFKKLAV